MPSSSIPPASRPLQWAALLFVPLLAWTVGESFARERWGQRLASFDALLRRDFFNATVGAGILRGLLSAPVVAAAAVGAAVLPILLGLAHPIANKQNDIPSWFILRT